MSHISDAHLVRVRAFEELTVGMTVVVKNCVETNGKDAVMVLVAHEDPGRCVLTGNRGFKVAPNYGDPEQGWCFCGSLYEGTLYRLRDLDAAEEEGRRIATDIDDHKRARRRERTGFPLSGRAR
ncbi:MAG: hypothetical protein LC640_09005 [Frankia sp.]|nr:hypothetical protein [Frankia sp.]